MSNDNWQAMPPPTVKPEAREAVVASYRSYADAEHAVDTLADHGFPVDHVSIAARDLVLVEQMLEQRSFRKTALVGAAVGAVIGLLVGFGFGLLGWIMPIVSAISLAVWGMVFGGVTGALAAVAMSCTRGPGRGLAGVGRLEASRYDVLTGGADAQEARRILREAGAVEATGGRS
jgi:hypothetical protein